MVIPKCGYVFHPYLPSTDWDNSPRGETAGATYRYGWFTPTSLPSRRPRTLPSQGTSIHHTHHGWNTLRHCRNTLLRLMSSGSVPADRYLLRLVMVSAKVSCIAYPKDYGLKRFRADGNVILWVPSDRPTAVFGETSDDLPDKEHWRLQKMLQYVLFVSPFI